MSERRPNLVPRGVLGEPSHGLTHRQTSGTRGIAPRPLTPKPAHAGADASSHLAAARVLVVEPVAILRTIITRALAARGYSVTAVGTLADLQRMLPSVDPHVIVTELSLPDGAGDHVCKRIKARPDKLRPVVLLSGMPESDLARRAAAAGADRYHCKSRGLSELIELVDSITAEIVF